MSVFREFYLYRMLVCTIVDSYFQIFELRTYLWQPIDDPLVVWI